MDTADLVRKIRALLATAESFSAAGNEEAAGAYIGKAHALQQKHSIGEAILAARGNGQRRPSVVSRTWVMPGAYGRRKVTLAHVVTRRTGCTGYFQSGTSNDDGRYRFVIFGFPADVEWAETLTYSLCHQADTALTAASTRRAPWEHGRSFATSFLAGFTATVDARLGEASASAAEAEAGEAAEAGTSVALVLRDKAEMVDAELRARVGNLRTSRTGGGTSVSGYDQGRAAGRRASLTRGRVPGGSRRRLPR